MTLASIVACVEASNSDKMIKIRRSTVGLTCATTHSSQIAQLTLKDPNGNANKIQRSLPAVFSAVRTPHSAQQPYSYSLPSDTSIHSKDDSLFLDIPHHSITCLGWHPSRAWLGRRRSSGRLDRVPTRLRSSPDASLLGLSRWDGGLRHRVQRRLLQDSLLVGPC